VCIGEADFENDCIDADSVSLYQASNNERFSLPTIATRGSCSGDTKAVLRGDGIDCA
jgi:hypothetical protein